MDAVVCTHCRLPIYLPSKNCVRGGLTGVFFEGTLLGVGLKGNQEEHLNKDTPIGSYIQPLSNSRWFPPTPEQGPQRLLHTVHRVAL